MIAELLALGGSGLLPIAAVMAARQRQAQLWQAELVCYRLRFPRGLDPEHVTTFLNGLSGLAERSSLVVRAIVFEVTATPDGIGHWLVMPESLAPSVLTHIRAALPGVGVEQQPDRPQHRYQSVIELRLTNRLRPLRTDQPEAIAASILASLLPLEAKEGAIVQWTISPLLMSPQVRKPAAKPRYQMPWSSSPPMPDPDTLKAARRKEAAPLFLGVVRLGVRSKTPYRRRLVMRRLRATVHSTHAPQVTLSPRRMKMATARRHLANYEVPLVAYPGVFNTHELTALLALPMGDVALPGLELGGTRQLAPSPLVPSTGGRIVATASFPGAERPLALSADDARAHLHCIGVTGTGKSTALVGMIASDIRQGHGVCVIDPKGDLLDEVLAQVPANRHADVIVLDPSDSRPVGFDPLAGSDEEPELVVNFFGRHDARFVSIIVGTEDR